MANVGSSVPRSFVVMRFCAWGVVVTIVLGLVMTVPAVATWVDELQATSPGREYIGLFMLVVFFNALVLWLAAARHSWVTAASSGTTLLLLFTNFVGALFYYFLIARRASRRRATVTAP